jgi:ubiquinone/menaquinone biosynthesis C-methylase UbiE
MKKMNLSRLYTHLEDRLYYELAPAYDTISWLVSAGQWDRWRKLALPYVIGRRILEVGFGTGILLTELAQRDYLTFGLDLSPAMHYITATRIVRRNLHATQIRGVVQSLPFASASFDTVISTFPAAFILDPVTIREIARSLSPGGCFILVDMCLFTNSQILQRLARGLGIQTQSEIDWLERTLTESGLSIHFINQQHKGLHVLVVVANHE